MYKLDLTKEVIATGIRRNQMTNENEQVLVKTPLSAFVNQQLNRVGTFEEAEKVRSLITKVETDKVFEVTPEEMKIVLRIFQRSETKTMLAFSDMAKELNKDFDIIQFEKNLNVPAM